METSETDVSKFQKSFSSFCLSVSSWIRADSHEGLEPFKWKCLEPLDQCFAQILERWIKMAAGDLVPHVVPQPFNQIQIGAVGRQRHQAETVCMLEQERIQLGSDVR